MIGMDEIKETWFTREDENLIIAADMMNFSYHPIYPEMLLSEAVELAGELSLDVLPVIRSKDDKVFMGLLDTRFLHQTLAKELIARKERA